MLVPQADAIDDVDLEPVIIGPVTDVTEGGSGSSEDENLVWGT
jgi:hypothetical protein